MNEERLEAEFQEVIAEDGQLQVIFSMAQELVQDKDPELKEVQALNIIVGASFALLHAIRNYKEIKDGENVSYGS